MTVSARPPMRLAVEGEGLTTPEPALADPAARAVAVPVAVDRPVPGPQRAARVVGEGVSVPARAQWRRSYFKTYQHLSAHLRGDGFA